MKFQELPIIERKVIYLILQIGMQKSKCSPSNRYLLEANKAAKKLDIKFNHIKVRDSQSERYFFRFPWYKRDDEKANKIAESLIYAVNIVKGPIGDSYESAIIFPIPSILIKNVEEISSDILIKVEENRPYDLRVLEFPGSIGSFSSILDYNMALAWKITPLIYSNDNLFNAARYLKESQDNFYVWPGQLDDVISDSLSNFSTGWELGRLEATLINTFKVVEALFGYPSSNDKKLVNKICMIGIDPNEKFGVEPKLPLFKFVRVMKEARDKSSAHGSTSPKNILVRDMLLYQDCARYLLMKAIEHYCGEKIYTI
ncbi:MAG: hypothetical protein JXA42_02720 [Anaerolineales bacterium]|nr:hypothetical protein [Anaerolineales bacterium]